MIFMSVMQRFTAAEVALLAPDIGGVYVILADRDGHFSCLFVGGGNVRDELERCLSADEPCIQKMGATHFQYARSTNVATDAQSLRVDMRPLCP